MGGRCRNFSYEDVHVEGTQRIAEAVAKYDCDRFIQVSCYNADLNSPSEYNRTKVCWADIEPAIATDIRTDSLPLKIRLEERRTPV